VRSRDGRGTPRRGFGGEAVRGGSGSYVARRIDSQNRR
jgi:hypothetical protein